MIVAEDDRLLASRVGAGRERPSHIKIVAVSLLAIVPCFWQSQIHAMDLPSHTYNAWIASLLAREHIDGLVVDLPWTNVVFDLLLASMAHLVGFGAAETIAVVAAVLTFFWGTFALIARIHAGARWSCVPLLLMLTYGLIFRLGFFNFYLATGFAAAACATWNAASWRRITSAVLLAIVSVCANPIPLIYCIGAVLYISILQRLKPVVQILMLMTSVGLLIYLGRALVSVFPTVPASNGMVTVSAVVSFVGFDQIWIYSHLYLLLSVAGTVIMLAGLTPTFRALDANRRNAILHLLAINIVLMTALPSGIQFPVHKVPLGYLPARISLFSGVLVCCLMAKLPARHVVQGLLGLVCVGFFALTLRDDIALTRFNAELREVVDTVPTGSRVLASMVDLQARVNPLLHLVDRACLGRCFSYGNYEPATMQFRVKAIGQNNIVLTSPMAIRKVEEGSFTISDVDVPAYAVCNCTDSPQRLCANRLIAGEQMCSVRLSVVGM